MLGEKRGWGRQVYFPFQNIVFRNDVGEMSVVRGHLTVRHVLAFAILV